MVNMMPFRATIPAMSGITSSDPTDPSLAQSHYENFPVASWLCPPRLRPPIAAIYGFARTADDLADEGVATSEQRLADLADFRGDLDACVAGGAVSPRWAGVFAPLGVQIRAFGLPVQLLHDLISAFEQDIRYTGSPDEASPQEAHQYADHAELLRYCALSANPVGRLLLHLYGVTKEAALQESDAICSALQLINFWQDPSRDIPNKRFYFPADLMAAHGVSRADLATLVDTLNTTQLIAQCDHMALTLMQKGLKLPARVASSVGGFSGWRAALELRCVMHGGARILHKMRALQHRTLSQRPVINAWDGIVILAKALRQSML
jgi:hydroxysqualene synthase